MLTQDQIIARKAYLGSSDSAAVCGLSPYRTAFDVWADKVGRDPGFRGNDATHAGNLLEPSIIEWAVQHLDLTDVRRSPPQITRGIMAANLDAAGAMSSGDPVIIEAKSGGITSQLDFAKWGDEYSDDVPDEYAVQVQHQLAVAGPHFERAFLAALIPPRGFVLYELPRDEEAIGLIVEACERFWRDYVVTGTPPPGSAPSLNVAKRLRRRPKSETAVSEQLVIEWEQAKDSVKDSTEWRDRAQAALLAAMGDAEGAVYPGGRLTYFEQTRKSYVVKESTFRVLRNKRG